MPLLRIEPAQLAYDDTGVPCSQQYDDVYHSRAGGLAQSRQVFLAGNQLPQRWQGRARYAILETGFGIGLNFLATWAAWRDDPQRCRQLHFIAIEKHPFRAADLQQLYRQWPELAAQSEQLLACWPMLTPGCHRLEFEQGQVVLTLILDDVQTALKNLAASVDAIYLDGFAPARNPDMWSLPVFKALTRLAHQHTTLATWCVAGAVREGLTSAGFMVEKAPGFGGKKAMLTGTCRVRRTPAPANPPATAIVIGAGLAGCSIASRLAARGTQVELLERCDGPAQATSGNWAGCYMPLPSQDDNLTSRLVRAGFLRLRQQLQALRTQGLDVSWQESGVLQIGKDEANEQTQRELLQQLGCPPELVCYLDRLQASHRCGIDVPGGGWWFEHGGWARPASVCQALLQQAGAAVRTRYGVAVASIIRQQGLWQAFDANGALLAAADVLVLANAADAKLLQPDAQWPLELIRGQIDYLPTGSLPQFTPVLCREGYVMPAVDGVHVLGASYDFRATSRDWSEASWQGNLQRLARILPQQEQSGLVAGAGRVGMRCVSGDRMPIVGAVPDRQVAVDAGTPLAQMPRIPALYSLIALGSRGLAWAGICADLLADQIAGDPWIVERDLADALDPARFWLRQLRQPAS